MKAIFRLALALAGASALSACGTFQLASGVYPPAGTSAQQQQTDTLVCKDQANMAVNSAGNQTRDFLLGATIVGAPIAYAKDKSKERDVFAQCMTARGYTIVMPDGSTRQNYVAQQNVITKPREIAPEIASQASLGISLTLPSGWSKQPITANLAQRGISLFAENKTTDTGLMLSSVSQNGITDILEYSESKMAAIASALQNPKQSDITQIEINGRKAYRFTTSGFTGGYQLTYLQTVVVGSTVVVFVTTWTTSPNFDHQRSAMEELASDLTGL